MGNNGYSETDTKERIFMVAAHLFAEKGFNGVSMREISEGARVTKPMIYYYFKNKEEIYKALVDAGFEHSRADLNRISAAHRSTREQLAEMVRERIRDCEQYTDLTKIIINLYLSTEKLNFLTQFTDKSQEPLRKLELLIQDGIDRGEVNPKMDARLAAEIFGAIILYYLWRQVERGGEAGDLGLAERIVDFVFKGLDVK
jgi:AcrR family transcriptional regulator